MATDRASPPADPPSGRRARTDRAWWAANVDRIIRCLELALGLTHVHLASRLGLIDVAHATRNTARKALRAIEVPRARRAAKGPRQPRGRPRLVFDRAWLLDALRRNEGNLRAVARETGIARATLARHVAELPPEAWAYGAHIAETHAMLLARSGVSSAVALARGYRSSATGLRIPLYDVTGACVWEQLRIDSPRTRRFRYRNPRGASLVVDVPPAGRAWVLDGSRPLYVTESPRKADAGVSAGLACVDIPGCRMLCRDPMQWSQIGVDGREVFLAFDGDAICNPEVATAEGRMAVWLELCGARVSVIRLPLATKGLDDYLAAGHSEADLRALARPVSRLVRGRGRPE